MTSLVAFLSLFPFLVIGMKPQTPIKENFGSTVIQLPGAIAPTGYFDPLSLSRYKSGNSIAGMSSTLSLSTSIESELKKWREAELKHGRVAMLATIGFLIQESFHPLFGIHSE
jgi:hypothetical protein